MLSITADLGNPDEGRSFVEQAIAGLGSVDILVTNAGGPPPGMFESTEIDAYQMAFDMNCKAMIEMCRVAIPPMRERGWGRVCAITSVGVKQPIPFLLASSVARAGLTSFLKITAREVAADGVTVNSAQPGTHWTDRVAKMMDRDQAGQSNPMGICGESDDFGAAVAFKSVHRCAASKPSSSREPACSSTVARPLASWTEYAALGDAGGFEGPAGEHPGEVIAVVRRGVQVGGGVRALGGLLSSLSR